MSAAARFLTNIREILSSLIELYLMEEYRTVPLPRIPKKVMRKQKIPRGTTWEVVRFNELPIPAVFIATFISVSF